MNSIIDGQLFLGFMSIGAEAVFYITTLVFLFFSLSLAYHWFAYGTDRAHSFAALALYLGISGLLFISILFSLNTVL